MSSCQNQLSKRRSSSVPSMSKSTVSIFDQSIRTVSICVSYQPLTSSPQKDGDSLSRRSMSRTEEDIQSGVDITIMRYTALRTYPASYSEVCDTFRPRLAGARRTDSGGERFIHFLVPSPVRRRFIAEHVSEEIPACIKNRLRQAGLGESGGIHIADRDVIELSNDADREFMVKVTAGM